jgi:F0F1-type ATP synthase membrane subunit b/b'
MKPRIGIAIIAGAVLCPTLAFAAERPEANGSWFSLIFYVINFVIFLWILNHYAAAPVVKYFRDRATGMRDTLGRADAAFQEAQDLANRAAERIARLEAEKAQISSDLADETVYQVGRIYDLAQETVARIKHDTETTVTALQEGAQRRARESLAAGAGYLARELVERNFVPADQRRLLDSFLERLREEAGG